MPRLLRRHATTTLRGYELIERLRRGHALDVWDAWSLERGCRCIVKTIRPDRVADAEVRTDFRREAELLTTLAHPHLVRGYEYVMGDRPALAMETLSGDTLARLIDDAPLDSAEAAELGLQVGSALHYLHQRGVLHLDVKPDNVVAEAGKAKLLDLSVARPIGTSARGIGTWCYLSPEQARGESLTTAADVWGLAVTLHESLTGEDAFDGPEKYPQLHRPAADLSPGNGLHPRLARLLGSCLSPLAPDRPPLPDVMAELEALARVPRRQRRWNHARAWPPPGHDLPSHRARQGELRTLSPEPPHPWVPHNDAPKGPHHDAETSTTTRGAQEWQR